MLKRLILLILLLVINVSALYAHQGHFEDNGLGLEEPEEYKKAGNITDEMMFNTYNMGLGMVLAVDPADVDKTMEALKAAGETCYEVGEIVAGEKGIDLV